MSVHVYACVPSNVLRLCVLFHDNDKEKKNTASKSRSLLFRPCARVLKYVGGSCATTAIHRCAAISDEDLAPDNNEQSMHACTKSRARLVFCFTLRPPSFQLLLTLLIIVIGASHPAAVPLVVAVAVAVAVTRPLVTVAV